MWCHKAAGGGIANLTEMTTALTAALTVEKRLFGSVKEIIFLALSFTQKKKPQPPG